MKRFKDEYVPSINDSFEYVIERIADKFGDVECQAFVDHIIYKETIKDLEYIYGMKGLKSLFSKIRSYIKVKE